MPELCPQYSELNFLPTCTVKIGPKSAAFTKGKLYHYFPLLSLKTSETKQKQPIVQ